MATNFVIKKYPLSRAGCHVCGSSSERTLLTLETHYSQPHGCSIRWTCSICGLTKATSRGIAPHYSHCSTALRRANGPLPPGSDAKQADDAVDAALPNGSDSGLGAGENSKQFQPTIILNYPSVNNNCSKCSSTLTSRVNLETQYTKEHSLRVIWQCTACQKGQYPTSHSASSHYAKCRKRIPNDKSPDCQPDPRPLVPRAKAAPVGSLPPSTPKFTKTPTPPSVTEIRPIPRNSSSKTSHSSPTTPPKSGIVSNTQTFKQSNTVVSNPHSATCGREPCVRGRSLGSLCLPPTHGPTLRRGRPDRGA
ncbi:uncharacterized protein [Dermacentor albipictus]|uniref:uncharacterized protein n=1 Tax=Dermacentor albipictus TaxID=60249 RepID=UPI0038FBF3C4